MTPHQKKLARFYENEIAEHRRKIIIWQTYMPGARPTDAANLQDQISAAERAIADLEAKKIRVLVEPL